MKKHSKMKWILATLLAVAVLVASFSVAALADDPTNYVTVNNGTTKYESMDAAAAAAEAAEDGSVTYTIFGSVKATGKGDRYSPDLTVGGKATSVSIKGGNDAAALTLNGGYYQEIGAVGAKLSISNLTLYNDRHSSLEGSDPDPWEFCYLQAGCASLACTNVTFTDGITVSQDSDFENCTFNMNPRYYSNLNDGKDYSTDHYGLWVHNYGKVVVNNCTFNNIAYGAIKGTWNRYISAGDPAANATLTVTNTKFNNIGKHSVVHMDGLSGLTFTGNTMTDCYYAPYTDSSKASIVTIKDDSCGGAAAVNTDYFGSNSMKNTTRYTLNFKTADGKAVKTDYYQYNAKEATALDPVQSAGYTYSVLSGTDVWTNAALTDSPINQIPVGTSGPRNYVVGNPTANQYQVTFDGNGGTGTLAAQTYTYDKEAALPKNTFVKDGSTFVGWSTAKDGTAEYTDGQTVKNLSEGSPVTLYAVWRVNTPVKVIRHNILLAQAIANGYNKAALSWTKVDHADGYYVYFAKCNDKTHTYDFKQVQNIKGGSNLRASVSGLTKGTAYKFYVAAYKNTSKGTSVFAKSVTLHMVAGNSNKTYTNAQAVRLSARSLTVSSGKTGTISASLVKCSASKQLLGTGHCKTLRYISSDKSVATVNSKGVVTGVKAGSCTIYVLAPNGVRSAVHVTVK